MKYSTIFFIFGLILVIILWTGLPFAFIRIFVTLLAVVLGVLSIGLYQREEKINLIIKEYRNLTTTETPPVPTETMSTLGDVIDTPEQHESHTETHRRKKLSDVLS